jgi:hypothetical protein
MLILILLALFQGEAHAWYGPICYSDRTTQLTLTIPSISGETPGDLKVDFDDNDGKVKLGGVRASPSVKNAHEVLLVRDADAENGIFAVVVTSPRSTTGYKFELEFRKDASECTGAIVKATDHAASSATLASAHTKRVAHARPKAAPSPAPAEEIAVSTKPADSEKPSEAEAKPLPTPLAGSEAPAVEAPAVSEKQEAGEVPKTEAPQAEAPVQPTATPQEAGSEAPAVSEKQQAGEAPEAEQKSEISPSSPESVGTMAPAP